MKRRSLFKLLSGLVALPFVKKLSLAAPAFEPYYYDIATDTFVFLPTNTVLTLEVVKQHSLNLWKSELIRQCLASPHTIPPKQQNSSSLETVRVEKLAPLRVLLPPDTNSEFSTSTTASTCSSTGSR